MNAYKWQIAKQIEEALLPAYQNIKNGRDADGMPIEDSIRKFGFACGYIQGLEMAHDIITEGKTQDDEENEDED